ncbi:MAG TPA: peptidylprolyl isomerase [Bacteroidota bacterium]|nr:peptidylprolyl isomerase [Bacteroidota bacterium]
MKLILLPVLVFASHILFAQGLPQHAYRAILTAQDLRDAAALLPFLRNDDANIRAQAAFACGSIQDTSHIPLLADLLTDENHRVRYAAAFALGQLNPVVDSLQREFVSRVLVRRLGLEANIAVLLRVIEALGKVGSAASLSHVVAAGESSPTLAIKGEAALSVGRFAYRGIVSKAATAYAAQCLGLRSGEEAWKAGYALMRINDASLLVPHEDGMVRAASSPHGDLRMFIATAMGRLSSSSKGINTLLSLVRRDRDWRVRVNALRALASADTIFYARVVPSVMALVRDTNAHVAITAVTTLGELRVGSTSFAAECRRALNRQLADTNRTERHRREAAVALAKIFGNEAYAVLYDAFRQGTLDAESVVAALAFIPTADAVQLLLELGENASTRLRVTVLESLHGLVKRLPGNSNLVPRIRPFFVAAMESDDLAVLSTAAEALADSLLRAEDSASMLVAALRRLKSPEDAEALVAIMQSLAKLRSWSAVAPLESFLYDTNPTVRSAAHDALLKITGRDYEQVVRPESTIVHTNFDWDLLDSIRRNPTVRVVTNRGSFVFRLLPDEAPFTCINFVTLIRKNFFDGLTFHRVVPNFVIQGGDPRGDGWGGPGYSIRSEFGFEHYTRGTVGVASAGKDTEGCQWFVTHCNTPHLDGRYTIFGKVVSGMEIVDAIQVGDIIEYVKWERADDAR